MPHSHYDCFRIIPVSAALISFCAWLYLRGWICICCLVRKRQLAGRQLFSRTLFLVSAGIATCGTDHDLLTVHMIKHLLLMTVAPVLISR